MPPVDNTPNFDSMTPEEIMLWMESLAKRQGATEGFMTEANVEVPEIDPTTVVIDEPGYVPSEGKDRGKRIGPVIPTAAAKPAAPEPSAPKAVEPPPAPKPVEVPPPARVEPIIEKPAAALPIEPPPPTPAPRAVESAAPSGLSWLESLAADQGMPDFDLSSLAADLSPAAPASTPAATNPISWLESLTQESAPDEVAAPVEEDMSWLESLKPAEAEPQAAAPAVDDNIFWLEGLARRQGAREEELASEAGLDLPIPEAAQPGGPGYTSYTFATPTFETPAEVEPPQDPAAWLDSLASAAAEVTPRSAPPPLVDSPMSDTEIQQALKRGEVIPHDQMEAWMNRQLEIGAQRTEPEPDYDPEAPAVKAEIPDWLLEQVGEPVPLEAPPAAQPALIESILEPPSIPTENIPDWLREEEPESGELDTIFASSASEAPAAPPAVVYEAQGSAFLDPNDPWVEALELEYQQRAGEATPPAIVSPPPSLEPLQATALPHETELEPGEPEGVPDWLQDVTGGVPAAVEAMPDWLTRDLGGPAPTVEISALPGTPVPVGENSLDWLEGLDVDTSEIPQWLREAIATSDAESIPTPPPASAVVTAPQPVVIPAAPPPQTVIVPAAPPPAPRPAPAPVPAPAAGLNVGELLSAARAALAGNNVQEALSGYEQVIRANSNLDEVIDDLTRLVDKVKTSAAAYRVLGDGLMRKGRLQDALDTYRKALNQL
ncbi:MAG: hypothetical protein JNM70_20320 [Anaerolineae bacterium]|nr:hypothetical protein [Anaerolineae bacterium]